MIIALYHHNPPYLPFFSLLSIIEELIPIFFNTAKDISYLNLIFNKNKPMQLSVDQKIQAAIQPLIQRITHLQAENEKFKQEFASLHAATQPKTAHKPPTKPTVEPVQRPQTVKGGRKKSIQNHEVKPDNKTDKKPPVKKEETKVEGEQQKIQSSKHVGPKTPAIGNKVIASPNTNKDSSQGANGKDAKVKPTTGTGNRVSTTNLNNKSVVVEKKPAKTHQNEHEKKEGEEHTEEKKEHASHEKVDNHKSGSVHNPKTPVINKGKVEKPADKKPVHPVPATGTAAKKGGKGPAVDTKKKLSDPKVEPPKEEVKQQHKEEVKEHTEEVKEEHKQPEVKQEADEKKAEEKGEEKVEEKVEEHHEQPSAETEAVKEEHPEAPTEAPTQPAEHVQQQAL